MNGDELTRLTIRAALVFYASAAILMPWLTLNGWRGRDVLGRIVRACWLLAWLCYISHVALAFHHFHHWSHAEAVHHVDSRSGFGPGIVFSYVFTLAWMADVLWWCIDSENYARRPAWVGYLLYAYMLFMAFNATVVYETGVIRIAGIIGSVLLILSLVLRLCLPPLPGDVK